MPQNQDSDYSQKIVLVSIYSKECRGLRIIANYLKFRGYQNVFLVHLGVGEYPLFKIKDINGQDVQKFTALIESIDPDFLCFSYPSPYASLVVSISMKYQKSSKRPYIIHGGVHPTLKPEECIYFCDALCIGDGAEGMFNILKNFGSTKMFKTPGFWFNKDRKIIRNNHSYNLQNVNKSPFPSYSSCEEYTVSNNIVRKGFSLKYGLVATTVGCQMKCSFCNSNTFNNIFINKYIRIRDVQSFIHEMQLLKSKGIRKFWFTDEKFHYAYHSVEQFCQLYKEKVNLPFCINLSSDIVYTKSFIQLKEAGLEGGLFAVQSGSEKSRQNTLNRYQSSSDIIKASKVLSRLNLNVTYEFILGNPFENESDYIETFRLISKLKRPFSLSFHTLQFFPRTKITKKALSENKISRKMVQGIYSKPVKFHMDYNIVFPKNPRERFWYVMYIIQERMPLPVKTIIGLSRCSWFRIFILNLSFISVLNKFHLKEKLLAIFHRLISKKAY